MAVQTQITVFWQRHTIVNRKSQPDTRLGTQSPKSHWPLSFGAPKSQRFKSQRLQDADGTSSISMRLRVRLSQRGQRIVTLKQLQCLCLSTPAFCRYPLHPTVVRAAQKGGRKIGAARKLSEKCRKIFLTISVMRCPARNVEKRQKIIDTFEHFLTWALSAGPFCGPLMLQNSRTARELSETPFIEFYGTLLLQLGCPT